MNKSSLSPQSRLNENHEEFCEFEFFGEHHVHSQRSMLSAGRGNSNWTAVAAREAFFALGMFAVTECRLSMDDVSGLGGAPQRHGIAKRFYKYIHTHKDAPGVELLARMYRFAVRYFSTCLDSLIFEFVESVIGNQYPHPVRMLHYCEKVVREFLRQELYAGSAAAIGGGQYDLFAVDGRAAAICRIFDSLVANRLLRPGDRIALGAPLPKAYAAISQLGKYRFDVVHIHAAPADMASGGCIFPDTELDKLADPSVKAFFIIDLVSAAGVPDSGVVQNYDYLARQVVAKHNPNLMIVTDDIYAPFIRRFGAVMSVLPQNTISIYSFSDYFGCTGWRLGVVAVNDENIFDRMIAALPQSDKEHLARRYTGVTADPDTLKFIDRMAADSREAVLGYTAGLSTPQQAQMAFFAGFAILDRMENRSAYKKRCNGLLQERYAFFREGLGADAPVANATVAGGYYCLFDLHEWALRMHGKEFLAWFERHISSVDVVMRLAHECAMVMLDNGVVCGPDRSLRLSLANFDSFQYKNIGRILSSILQGYVDEWKNEKRLN
ncbi:MAG: bifunctional aspartate transaminase/aspartate 4-decarboxylase [Rikenellaceae bacterium]|nr:bifunctional aspartate transaminase/aspartate 4-decarboxylase [Rikenellaceae bacterium]MCL2692139.1 bifunctional aspartate transaminase/aspartate 4-decarboxylase [Rikenellaceae bacterium]